MSPAAHDIPTVAFLYVRPEQQALASALADTGYTGLPLTYGWELVLPGTGVELSTKMSDLLRDAFKRRGLRGEPRVALVEMAAHVVPGMDEGIRSVVEGVLEEKRVELFLQTRVARVLRQGV